MKKQELKQILDEGEGYKIEFKENLSALDKELKSVRAYLLSMSRRGQTSRTAVNPVFTAVWDQTHRN